MLYSEIHSMTLFEAIEYIAAMQGKNVAGDVESIAEEIIDCFGDTPTAEQISDIVKNY